MATKKVSILQSVRFRTTLAAMLVMLLSAVLGNQAAAAGWAFSPEEIEATARSLATILMTYVLGRSVRGLG
jgi:hypothetical protein